MTTPETPAPRQTQDTGAIGADEQRLADLGYRQELSRAWSGFTNFAISFTIISVLAGTFTTFAFAWQNGGPIAVSIGWPVLCFFVLLVAARPRRQGLELDDRLVQHRRARGHRGVGRLRLRDLHERHFRPVLPRHLWRQL